MTAMAGGSAFQSRVSIQDEITSLFRITKLRCVGRFHVCYQAIQARQVPV
jgi:hypothetical protein